MPDRPGIAARVFRTLADVGVNVDMIVQNVSARRAHRHLVHAAEDRSCGRAEGALEPLAREIGAAGVAHDPEIAKISLVGAGMKTHPGVAADMFDALAEAGINIGIISTSSVRISCVVPLARRRARRAGSARALRSCTSRLSAEAEATASARRRSGAPYGRSTSGTSPWKFSRIASAIRSTTAVPFSVCTGSAPRSPR